VGVDTGTYASGLRAALRQDPDVVVIGELADADTVSTAIKAAESGFLVITSMPTPDVATTVERVVSMLPKDEREIGRVRFAECLRGIVAQQLLPRHDESGKIVVCEVLLGTPDVRAALRDTARNDDLKGLMTDGASVGMQSFEQGLAALVTAGRITAEAARAATLPSAAPPPAGVPERRKRSKG
jgi:twitching motility protein PilT